MAEFKKTFPHLVEEWSSLESATAWLKERGYCVGEMQRGSPIGVARDACIGKWRTLTKKEIAALDGTITAPNGMFRNGPAVVTLKDHTEPA